MVYVQVTTELEPKESSRTRWCTYHLLQAVTKELAPALTLLFYSSLATSQVPKQPKHALVQLVFKKGDRNQAANYWPISLTWICCKLLEHIVRLEITGHLYCNDIINDAQHFPQEAFLWNTTDPHSRRPCRWNWQRWSDWCNPTGLLESLWQDPSQVGKWISIASEARQRDGFRTSSPTEYSRW